jgi:hypothetical protein
MCQIILILADYLNYRGLPTKYSPSYSLSHRVFKLKLDALMADLIKGHYLGRPIGYLYVVEFQKRGLPHAHILMILAPDDKPRVPADYDKIICAELPDPVLEPELFTTITTSTLHGPCGEDNPNCPCMIPTDAPPRDRHCKSHYPKDWCDETVETEGYPLYRRRDDGRFFLKAVPGQINNIKMDNRSVVPYNRVLSKKYNVSTISWNI